MKALLAALLLASGFVVPPPGSPLRRAVLEALRPEIERRLGPSLEFKVMLFRIQGDWAFVVADPLRRGGKLIDGRRIFGDEFGNMDGLRVDAVLRRADGRWTVVDHAIGATDVWYCDVGPKPLKTGWGC